MCSSSSTASPQQVDLRYTKFAIGGIPGDKHAVFVPDGIKLTLPVFSQICSAIGKEVPSTFLTGLGCLRHPSNLSTQELRDCRSFEELMQEAKHGLGFGEKEAPLSPSSRGLVSEANRVLEKKLAAAVNAMTTAARRSNAWTFTGPRISTFEVLLQQCIEQGGGDVFRLVAGHVQDRAYMEEKAPRHLLQQLFSASRAMSAQAVVRAPVVALSGDLWNPARNGAHPEFKSHGWEHWSFSAYSDREAEGHPATQWPWPHGDLFLLFYRGEAAPSEERPRVDWGYSTLKKHDLEAVPLEPEQLEVPVAHVVIGGDEASGKRRLLEVLKGARPVIILDNTPSIPKQVSLLLTAVKRVWTPSPLSACRPFLPEEERGMWGSPSSAELLQSLSAQALLRHVEKQFDCSGKKEHERLLASDVESLLATAQRYTQAFRESTCVLDPLRMSADEVVTQAMLLLSSRQVVYREQKSGMELRSLVLRAWRVHRRLAAEAAQLRLTATAQVLTVAATLLLTAVFAALAVVLFFHKANYKEVNYHVAAYLFHEKLELAYTWSEASRVLRVCLVVLPFLASVLILLGALCQFNQRWKKLHMACSILVSEVYYLLGVLKPYRGLKAAEQQSLFQARLRELLRKLPLSEQEELAPLLEMLEVDVRDDLARDARALEEHVDQHLYGLQPSWFRRKVEFCPASVRSLACGWTPEPRDFLSHVSSEDYVELRMLPLRRHFRAQAKTFWWRRTVLSAAFVLCLCCASALGALGRSLWVPLPLGLASFVAVLAHWFAPSEMIMAVTSALAVLNSLDMRWHGSDIRENRSDASMHHLISNTERISRVVAMVYTRSTSIPGYGEDDEEWIRGHAGAASRERAW